MTKQAHNRGDGAKMVTAWAEDMVEYKYGPRSANPLSYHSCPHTHEVRLTAHQIAMKAVENGRISHKSTTLLDVGAACHDLEQGLGAGRNEDESAALAEREMEKTGVFSKEEILAVKEMILATKCYFKDGVMSQSANKPGLSDEVSYLCQILADADLATLGARWEIRVHRMTAFMRELLGNEHSHEEHKKFYEGQLVLLQNHQFYTPEARELYPFQEENACELAKRIELFI